MKNTTSMLEDNPYLDSYKDAPWCNNPKAYQNIVDEDEHVIVFKDRYPVTEGHLLFVPKSKLQRINITICFEYAWEWGVKGIMDYKWTAFNVGINNGKEAGQTVMWPHVHMIPRREGDLGYFENGTPHDPRGGIRNVIPGKGNYND
jgi:diadenosine tetraphosphate (Ap4A) HIT family hydrolase